MLRGLHPDRVQLSHRLEAKVPTVVCHSHRQCAHYKGCSLHRSRWPRGHRMHRHSSRRLRWHPPWRIRMMQSSSGCEQARRAETHGRQRLPGESWPCIVLSSNTTLSSHLNRDRGEGLSRRLRLQVQHVEVPRMLRQRLLRLLATRQFSAFVQLHDSKPASRLMLPQRIQARAQMAIDARHNVRLRAQGVHRRHLGRARTAWVEVAGHLVHELAVGVGQACDPIQ